MHADGIPITDASHVSKSASFSPGSHTSAHARILPYTPATHLEIQGRNVGPSNGHAGVLDTPPIDSRRAATSGWSFEFS